ncbi:glutamine--fructose-6-phosphate transaminase (isomerizing) [Candidatus Micrarchaeota archaeon]|nr:glutamine--fructose-6-phosphate transaminase (isomerizing) [Candidatus Micrarchaeota archaeon]
MCGIFGYIGPREAGPLLLEGLKKLEYRGYDSVGIATIADGLHIRKGPGKIREVEEREALSGVPGTMGISHCLHPDTFVQLANGEVRKISQVADEPMLALSFKDLRFSKHGSSGGKHPAPAELIRLKTDSFSLKCTPNHRMFVFENGSILEKTAEELEVGDLMLCCQTLPFEGAPQPLESVDAKRYYRVSREAWDQLRTLLKMRGLTLKQLAMLTGVNQSVLEHLKKQDRNLREDHLKKIALELGADLNAFTPVNSIHGKFTDFPNQTCPELMDFLGYLLGDGIVNERSIRFKDADPNLLAHYNELAWKLFHIRGRIVKVPEANAHLLEINSRDVCDWLRKNFVELTRRRREKTIPPIVGRTSLRETNAFLRGLFDAEGCVNTKSRQVSIRMNNHDVIHIVQLLLMRSSILSSLQEQSTQWGPSFGIYVSHPEGFDAFLRNIGFNSYAKATKLQSLIKSTYKGSRRSFKIPFTWSELREWALCKHRFKGKSVMANSSFAEAQAMLTEEGQMQLQRYVDSHVFFQRLVQKARIPSDTAWVYDLHVPQDNNFVANGLISHNSRWATHGGVTKENAHPHTDCKGEIAVVHNGIIENYQELKKGLAERGHAFKSQTDTEVLAHLLEEQSGPLEKRVGEAVKQLKGSFAVLAVSAKEPDKLVAVRNESPLVIGSGDGEFFAASDATPFLAHTRRAVFLEDHEMAVIGRKDVYVVSTKSGEILQKQTRLIDWHAEQASKGEHEHFMIKEILEQPLAIKSAFAQDPQKLEAFVRLLKASKDVKFVACGTSRHAALIGRYAFNQLAGKAAEVYIASEFDYFADHCTNGTLIIPISQSGETADVLVGLRKAKAKGAKIASIVNVVGSSIDRMSDVSLYLNCGPEIAVASTKAFAAQLSLLFIVAHALVGTVGECSSSLKKIAHQISAYMPKWQVQAKVLANDWKEKEHIYYIARGVNFPVALEGALKLKEVSYIHAEGMPAGELKHGTLALVEKGTPVVLINPKDYTFADTLGNGLETKTRGAKLIGVSNMPNDAYDVWIELPEMEPLFYPLLSIVPLQLLAYYSAVFRGADVDCCRNLAKSVTVR